MLVRLHTGYCVLCHGYRVLLLYSIYYVIIQVIITYFCVFTVGNNGFCDTMAYIRKIIETIVSCECSTAQTTQNLLLHS